MICINTYSLIERVCVDAISYILSTKGNGGFMQGELFLSRTARRDGLWVGPSRGRDMFVINYFLVLVWHYLYIVVWQELGKMSV